MPPGAPPGVELPGFIEIDDPVSGVHISLDAHNHTARQLSAPHIPPPPPPPALIGAVRSPVVATAPPGPRPETSQESLGTQTIEGVLAEGSRTTTIYPIGFFGNDRPLTTVRETWNSPELKTVVLSKNSDPRSGDSTTTLTNISRAEPDASLFQVPADYQVVDATGARSEPPLKYRFAKTFRAARVSKRCNKASTPAASGIARYASFQSPQSLPAYLPPRFVHRPRRLPAPCR